MRWRRARLDLTANHIAETVKSMMSVRSENDRHLDLDDIVTSGGFIILGQFSQHMWTEPPPFALTFPSATSRPDPASAHVGSDSQWTAVRGFPWHLSEGSSILDERATVDVQCYRRTRRGGKGGTW